MKKVSVLNILPKEVCQKFDEPVLIKENITNWAALNKWSWDYLKKLAGERTVRLVLGNREHNLTKFREMKLVEYIDKYLAYENECKEKLYLKEFDLFKEFPQLKADVDYQSFFPWYVRPDKFAWIGEKGAITGLHHDIFDNFLAQVYGRKKLYLFAYKDIPKDYRSDKFDYGARVSLINAFNPDYERFPLFKTVEPFVVELVPGDVLYIPKGWWHQVKSLDATISIASFMVTVNDLFTTELMENMRRFIHNQGLYNKGNCTCHMN
ncbi:MAG: cupin-like domain-containing protein [Nostoc sp.]|uniref:cupin-like domain-containing protein n=1 Tax=Nostoc sp. TaxID=1180 RepID=UPI002FF70F62